MPDVPRGLTAEGGDETHDTHSQAMEKFDLQFVSYSLEHLPCQFVKQARENTIPVISWTIKSPADAEKAMQHSDQITFEGFDPDATNSER